MLRGHLVRDPAAQSTPWHYAPRDMMFTVIDNEVEFAAAGKCWPLKPMDMLVLPAGTPYKYTNYSRMETLFFSIGGNLQVQTYLGVTQSLSRQQNVAGTVFYQ